MWIISLYFEIPQAFDIFWIVVKTIFLVGSSKYLTKVSVLSVLSTEPSWNLLNSDTVCESRSLRSTKNITFRIEGSSDNSWLNLNDVNVLPEPVVCQTYALLLVSVAICINASTACTWYGLIIIIFLLVCGITIYLEIIFARWHFCKKDHWNSCKVSILLFSLSVQKNVCKKFISWLFAKYFVSLPFEIIKNWIKGKRDFSKDVLLYLTTWSNACLKSTPRRLSSICTNGSPLIKIVTSYLFSYLPNLFVIWCVIWNSFLHQSFLFKSSIYTLELSSRWISINSLNKRADIFSVLPSILRQSLSNSDLDNFLPLSSLILCLLICFLKFSYNSSVLLISTYSYPSATIWSIKLRSSSASLW